jgi:hypothetical protein
MAVAHVTLRESAERWLVLATASLASFVVTMNSTAVITALLQIKTDLDLSHLTEWVINVYILVAAVLVAVMGRLSDLFGKMNVFVLGLVAFGAGARLPRRRRYDSLHRHELRALHRAAAMAWKDLPALADRAWHAVHGPRILAVIVSDRADHVPRPLVEARLCRGRNGPHLSASASRRIARPARRALRPGVRRHDNVLLRRCQRRHRGGRKPAGRAAQQRGRHRGRSLEHAPEHASSLVWKLARGPQA